MAYHIFITEPVHCQITDGIIGSSTRPLRWYVRGKVQDTNTYETKALADKLAARMTDESHGACFCTVVPAGMTPADLHRARNTVASRPMTDDEMPF